MRCFALTALSASMLLLSGFSFALQVVSDSDLRETEGQDGIDISIAYSQADFNKLYWEDKAGTATGVAEQVLRATANTVKIRDTNSVDGLSLGAAFFTDTSAAISVCFSRSQFV